MCEVWLKPNRRALALGFLSPLLLAAAGAWLALRGETSFHEWWRWAGWTLCVAAALLGALLAVQLRRPRIGYRDGHVLFYLRSGPPIAVPAQIVEAFFLGQGPSHLPGRAQGQQTVNLVARLSQRETGWARRDVKPALGSWCEGYVTIRGTWCEPLVPDLIRHLNRRLKQVKTATEARDG